MKPNFPNKYKNRRQINETSEGNCKKQKIKNKKQNVNIDIHEKMKKKKHFLNRPFLRSYSGHNDSILCIKKHTKHPSLFFSGSADGQVKFWLISKKRCINSIQAHKNFIRDLAVDFTGSTLLTCSDDFLIKVWNISETNIAKSCFETNTLFNSISTHPFSHFFVTGGKEVLLWDLNKFKPIQKLVWGLTSISKIEFNPVEYNVISSCASDKSILLFDFRLNSPVSKIFLEMPSNDISWSYTNPLQFTVANEDANLYSFDIRNLNKIFKIYKGHVMPVLTIDQNQFSQTIVSGSYDSTLRLFKTNEHQCSEIFFTQRMRKILDVSFSLDGRYIISASEDGELRLWKNFEEKNYFYLNNNRYKVDRKNNNNFQKVNISSSIKIVPEQVKTMLYIKAKIFSNKKREIDNKNNQILPDYIKFKTKKKN
jgi:WD repeat and SOF domain-containing protein 1